MHCIDYQVASIHTDLPSNTLLDAWIAAALSESQQDQIELSLRMVDQAEMQQLNSQFRGKNSPTNVLSFPFDAELTDSPLRLLGDIVICVPIIMAEAKQQHKSYFAHFAHMVVHGVLHLLGHDHVEPQQAMIMETLESKILANLGFSNPYQEIA